MTFINHMIAKGDGHYLEDQPQWIKLYTPNTKMDRDKGISRASEKIRDMLRSKSKEYQDEIIKVEKDDSGSVIREITGMHRIPDPMLLEEIIHYNEETGNYDREVAFSLAIALAKHLDPLFGKIKDDGERVTSKQKIRHKPQLFGESGGMFRTRKKFKMFN